MATLDITIPINGYAGSVVRRWALQLEAIAQSLPDQNSTGASVVIRIDNNPSVGVGTVQAQAGPYTGSALSF
jgi:hypothetical protein